MIWTQLKGLQERCLKMINAENRVLTNVKEYIKDICTNVVNVESNTPTELPCVSVKQIDNPDTMIDLENTEVAVQSTIEIQSYSNKNITDSKNIISKCCDAMRLMGYQRIYGATRISNANDTNVYRMVARFRRIVTSIDEIQKF